MVAYGPLRPRVPWTGPPPVAFIDSNVMNEFYTPVDLARAYDSAFQLMLESRRVRTRGTLWMAMALDQERAATLTLEDEFLPFAIRHRPHHGEWLTLMLHFVRPHICPDWTALNLEAQLGKNKRNDTIIAEDAARRGIPVITRDGGVAAKAKRRNATSYTPEGYAQLRLSLDDARDRFFDRFEDRVLPWVVDLVNEFGERLADQCWWMQWARTMLRHVWSATPPPEDWALTFSPRMRQWPDNDMARSAAADRVAADRVQLGRSPADR
jgi:hypothetical protein